VLILWLQVSVGFLLGVCLLCWGLFVFPLGLQNSPLALFNDPPGLLFFPLGLPFLPPGLQLIAAGFVIACRRVYYRLPPASHPEPSGFVWVPGCFVWMLAPPPHPSLLLEEKVSPQATDEVLPHRQLPTAPILAPPPGVAQASFS